MGKLLLVTKEVSDYTDEELEQFREQFAPVAQKCRKRGLRIVSFFGYVFLLWLLYMGTVITAGVFRIDAKWMNNILVPLELLLLGLSLFFSFIFFVLSMSRVKCPACHKRLMTSRPVRYCPDCGSSQIKAVKWWALRPLPKCNACGKTLVQRGRQMRSSNIRFCTHCGVFLDEEGI